MLSSAHFSHEGSVSYKQNNFMLMNFSLCVSSWTSAYMGQTDPVSVFPSQQPLRKNPPGCSGVGCTGSGNPDDPVASPLPPLPLTAVSETAPVANWWKKPQMLGPHFCFIRQQYWIYFSPPGKMLQICVKQRHHSRSVNKCFVATSFWTRYSQSSHWIRS